MEKEVAVFMTNFALILNDLAASCEGRNEYIARLCRYPLLILDDFGMERGTEYGLGQVYSVPYSVYALGTSGAVKDSYAYKSKASDIESTASKPAVGLQRLFWLQAF